MIKARSCFWKQPMDIELAPILPYFDICSISDHTTLHIELIEFEKGSKPFHFYNSWLHSPSFYDVFEKAWKVEVANSPLYCSHQKLKFTKSIIKEWAVNNDNPTPKSRLAASKLQKCSILLAASPIDWTLAEKCSSLKEELWELQCRELLDTKQIAHINWLTQVDQCTTFFGWAVKKRQAHNSF